MVNIRFIYIKNKQYWYFDSTQTWQQAITIAKYYKKTEKNDYWIVRGEDQYHLFMTKIRKLLT